MKVQAIFFAVSTILGAGCVFVDPPSLPPNVYVGERDSGQDVAVEDATDATVEPDAVVEPDAEADAVAQDAGPDMVVVPDSGPDMPVEPDMGMDMPPDMPDLPGWHGCGHPFPPLASEIPQTSACLAPDPTMNGTCDIVRQTGCAPGRFCDVRPPTFAPTCYTLQDISLASCLYVNPGEVCNERDPNNVVVSNGPCFPGSSCPGLMQGVNATTCQPYCELATGLGCDPGFRCHPFNLEFGIGRCEPQDKPCPMPN